MATKQANAINETGPSGIVNFDGTATFSTTVLTQFNVLSGAGSNTVNNITPTSNSGWVLTSNGLSAQPTFQAIPFTQLPWTDEGTSFNALAGNGYFVTATATATLPASPSQGNTISFVVDSASGILTITANTGQKIQIGSAINTATGGTAANNKNGDSVTLVYRASDAIWFGTSILGTFTVS